METITISTTYALKWEVKNTPYYKVSKCGKVFNCKTGKMLKRIYNNGSIGYVIDGKFTTLANLRKELIEIKNKPKAPF